MKKIMKQIGMVLFISTTLSSCATVFCGHVTECQRKKPSAGEPQRKIRTGALAADILLFCPGLIVDFGTGAIYKPCEKKETK